MAKISSEIEKAIINMYSVSKMSSVQITDELKKMFPAEKFYPLKVIRVLNRNGIKRRDGSLSQKLSLENGIRKHPTKGKARTEEEKENISIGQIKYWQETLSDEEREKRIEKLSKIHKKRWEKMSSEEQHRALSNIRRNVQENMAYGSKLEKEISEALTAAGHNVLNRFKLDGENKKEIDILINQRFAIEIDGPVHFLPIFGEEELAKVIRKDEEKNKFILANGFNLCRIRYKNTNVRKSLIRKTVEIVDSFIKSEEKFKVIEA